MDLGVSLVAGSEPTEVVQVGEAALDDPALAPQPGAIRCSTTSDHRCDPERSQQPTVLVVVIASVGQQPIGLVAWPANLAGDRPAAQILEQRDQLGDVVAVATGQGDRQGDAAGVDEQMML